MANTYDITSSIYLTKDQQKNVLKYIQIPAPTRSPGLQKTLDLKVKYPMLILGVAHTYTAKLGK